MPFSFPHVLDVKLGRSPLAEVICQVRFPPILRIREERPIDLQEQIRHRFPGLESQQSIRFRLPTLGNSELPVSEGPITTYRFVSADGKSAASLGSDFYSISTNNYVHWAVFADDLQLMHDATVKHYRPAYATRIGLRYVNRLCTSNTGCKNMNEVMDLIRSEFTCLVRAKAWTDPDQMTCQLVVPDNGAQLAIRTKYDGKGDEPSFLLDFDYYREGQLDLDELVNQCRVWHEIIYDAFRWSLTEGSLNVFQPVVNGVE